MLLRSHARRCIDAPLSSSSSTPHSPHQGQPPGLIHLLSTLPVDVFTRIISLLTISHLEQFILSCWAARNMVYATHVNKLTLNRPYRDPNIRAHVLLMSYANVPRYRSHPQLFELKWPKRTVMSQRYPAVSHIAISSEYCNDTVGFCDDLVRHNSKNSMRGITHLDIDLTVVSSDSKCVMKSLSRLLRICTALKCLKLKLVVRLNHDRFQQRRADIDFVVSLTLCEQAPGQSLQQQQHLLARGLDLEHILDTAACISQLQQVEFRHHTLDSPHYDIICSALPKLSALRELTLKYNCLNPAPYTSQQLSMLTRLELSSVGHSCLHLDLDLPALKELTLSARLVSDVHVSYASSMHSLTRLSLDCIQLLPNNGMWGLTSLRHLSFSDCAYEGTSAALNSNLQALSGLTCLHAGRIKCLDTPDEEHATASLYLNHVLQLSELKLCCYEYDALQHIPTSLTSLSVFVRIDPDDHRFFRPAEHSFVRGYEHEDDMNGDDKDVASDPTIVRLPLTWLCCSQLRRLLVGGHCAWGQVLPLLAQLTTLEHLELGDRKTVNKTADASCLDTLTQLTYLRLGMKLAPPTWPLLSKSARLQQLEILRCWNWPTLPLPSSLVRLRVATNRSVPLPAHLSCCRSLQHLTVISWSAFRPISGITSLAPLTTLQELGLSGRFAASPTDVAAIANLTDLHELRLGGMNCTSLDCLSPLNQLSAIWCMGVPQELKQGLPQLLESGLFPNLKNRFYLCTCIAD